MCNANIAFMCILAHTLKIFFLTVTCTVNSVDRSTGTRDSYDQNKYHPEEETANWKIKKKNEQITKRPNEQTN